MGYFCDKLDGSSTGLILNLKAYNVLGIHIGKKTNNKWNIGRILKHQIYDYQKKYLNDINQKVPNIHLKINIINNNIENIHKREDLNRNVNELINRENKGNECLKDKKKIKEYYEIKINKDIIPCSYLNEFKDFGLDISLLNMD